MTKAAPPSESVIQRHIIQFLEGIDKAYALNVGGGASTAKGTSDLIVCYRGQFLALEVKRPDGTYGLTKPQAMRLAAVRKAEGVGTVVTSIADVVDLLRGLDTRLDR